MTLQRDVLGGVAIVALLVLGHVLTSDDGMKDINGVISQAEKAISKLIGWINRQ